MERLTPTGITRTISSPAGFTDNGPNHDGGPLVFANGNLHGVTGDLNRNGVEQNNTSVSAATANVGGVYRLDTNLNPASGNPFTGSFTQWYSYGVRNSFGLAVDPVTGNVWDTENGSNSYDDAVVVGDNNTGRLYLLRLNASRTGFVLTGDLADLIADTARRQLSCISCIFRLDRVDRKQRRLSFGLSICTCLTLPQRGA